MSLRFQKKREDFVCLNCGQKVIGSGYTDHCPKCLWSQHVDEFPGDRKSDCSGMMRPSEIEVNGDEYTICYICEKCKAQKKCKAAGNDDFEGILKLTQDKLKT